MRAGQTVNRELLQQDLYTWNDDLSSNTLEVHIHNLRRKLGKDRIRTVRGIGYRLKPYHDQHAPSFAVNAGADFTGDPVDQRILAMA